MSYHKFSNLREIFQGVLNRKLMDGIISHDFMDQPCNCNHASKIDGKCAYNGECRKMCVVYKATCKICNQPYIGQTQQKLKDHMGQHLNDVKKLVTKGTKLDSFASHFAQHCKKGVKPTSNEIRKMTKVKIVWQGNVISCMKSFGKLNCSLCMQKKILHTIRQEEWKMINHCNEIYGACQHKTRVHRFLKEHTNVKNTSTDDCVKPEKVCKYDNQDGLSVSDGSQESSPRPARVYDITLPPGALDICTLILVCV
jgi:thymidylate synthase ThyX